VELVGRGRDADVHAIDERWVLRRYRSGRSAAHEAVVMEHARRAGYPVPEVRDASGPDLVMARVSGPTMAADLARRPWRLSSHAALLADLHRRLAAIAAPPWLQAPVGPGGSLLHLDLHPGNVVLTPDAAWVIDWANAARGPAAADIAMTFLIVGGFPAARSPAAVIRDMLRRRFAHEFLRRAGGAGVAPVLAAVAERRASDANLLPAERAAVRELASRMLAA
jgi:aminoglycoside phosphotransferase (APT) family kinase protein